MKCSSSMGLEAPPAARSTLSCPEKRGYNTESVLPMLGFFHPIESMVACVHCVPVDGNHSNKLYDLVPGIYASARAPETGMETQGKHNNQKAWLPRGLEISFRHTVVCGFQPPPFQTTAVRLQWPRLWTVTQHSPLLAQTRLYWTPYEYSNLYDMPTKNISTPHYNKNTNFSHLCATRGRGTSKTASYTIMIVTLVK